MIKTKKERAAMLRTGVYDSFMQIQRFGVSKKEVREKHNVKIREDARRDGMSETDILKLKREESPFIHSISTFYQYREICWRYADWLADVHPDVHKLSYAHRMHYDREYIQLMIDRGLSASTIALTTSALAKLYRCHADDIHSNRPQRRYKDFTRSRNYREAQFTKDVAKYGDIAVLCRCAGLREVELEHLYPECFIESSNGDLFLHLDGHRQHTKGGKSRDVVILDANQNIVRNILSRFEAGKLMCPVAPSHLDIHGIRSMYATDYYTSIAKPITNDLRAQRIPLKNPKLDNNRPGRIRTSAPGVYRRGSDGKEFDREALLVVSRSLGHNRVDVVVHSYLR